MQRYINTCICVSNIAINCKLSSVCIPNETVKPETCVKNIGVYINFYIICSLNQYLSSQSSNISICAYLESKNSFRLTISFVLTDSFLWTVPLTLANLALCNAGERMIQEESIKIVVVQRTSRWVLSALDLARRQIKVREWNDCPSKK